MYRLMLRKSKLARTECIVLKDFSFQTWVIATRESIHSDDQDFRKFVLVTKKYDGNEIVVQICEQMSKNSETK